MSQDPHFGFVVAAYLAGLAVIAGTTAAILKDYAELKRALLKFGAAAAPERAAQDLRPGGGSPPAPATAGADEQNRRDGEGAR